MLRRWLYTFLELPEKAFFGRLLLTACLAAALLLIRYVFILHDNCTTLPVDSAVTINTLYNTVHGHPFRNTVCEGPNVLGVHTQFIFLLLAPVYALWQEPYFLIFLQTVLVYLTPYIIYRLGLRLGLTPLNAFMLGCLYLLSPYLLNCALAPLAPGNWIFVCVLASLYFYFSGNKRGFIISFLLAVSCGEMAALFYIAFGLSIVLSKPMTIEPIDRRKWAQISLGLGLAWIVLAMWLIPYMRIPGQGNAYEHNYPTLHCRNAIELLIGVLKHPGIALATILDINRWYYVWGLLSLPLVFSFIQKRTALLWLPAPFFFLMQHTEFGIYTHYYYFYWAFAASVMGTILVLQKLSWQSQRLFHVAAFALYAFMLAHLVRYSIYSFIGQGARIEPQIYRTVQFLRTIPSSATVMCQHRYSLHLANRANLVMDDFLKPLPEFIQNVEKLFPQTGVHYRDLEYIVVNMVTSQNSIEVMDRLDGMELRQKCVSSLLSSKKWTAIGTDGQNVIVLKRTAPEP